MPWNPLPGVQSIDRFEFGVVGFAGNRKSSTQILLERGYVVRRAILLPALLFPFSLGLEKLSFVVGRVAHSFTALVVIVFKSAGLLK